MEYVIKFIVIAIPILLIYFLYKRISYLSKYTTVLEIEYKNLIDLLYRSNSEQRQKILKEVRKTSLYKKIKWANADSTEKFEMMHENNDDIDDFN